MIRLFAALALPEAVRERLVQVRAPLPGARWVPLENLHVTLRFIGEVEPSVLQRRRGVGFAATAAPSCSGRAR
ncbi:MAG: RNA 2',3'-cyclic phosphodiesterase, partial [Alphaproteobacteria bacterium]|nr:RNA 2',3'-cyclic phosphodiesterase [Alphaproteobacteria bacterium]